MTVPPQFSQPGKADKFAPRDHPEWIGRLFLVYPDAVSPQTFNRPDGTQETTDVVTADVVIIDLPDPQTGQPTMLQGARIGGKGLVPQLRKMIASMVLGRLAKMPSQGQKDGAYYLADFTPQDAALATAWVSAHPRQAPFTQPAAQAPPAAPPAAVPQAPAYGAPAPAYAPPGTLPGQVITAPPAAPPAAPETPSPLAVFLASKGVPTQGMSEQQMELIAATYPDAPAR